MSMISSSLEAQIVDVLLILFVEYIMYADDLLLMSTSVLTLQSMLDICHDYGVKHDIIFNSGKSCCMKVGHKNSANITNMLLNNVPIEWVDNFKYLGVVFTTGNSLHVDCSYVKRKFYAACNAILVKCKYADDIIKLHLVKSFCLPLLTYCIGALDLPQYRVKELGVCWNDCFRKIFKFNRWESVAELQYFCGELPFEYMYDLYKWNFLVNPNFVGPVALLARLNYNVVNSLKIKYAMFGYTSRKHAIWQHFSTHALI